MSKSRIKHVAYGAAVYTFVLIVFGGIVRISGSGLGCGEAWPSCNGSWWPGWNLTVWIEWTHRLLAASAVLPFAAVLAVVWRERHDPAVRPLLRLALWSGALLLVQAVLGGITVKLGTNAVVTTLHFVNAMILLALLLSIAIGKQYQGAQHRLVAKNLQWFAVALALAVIAWGALTANMSAGLVCGRFPLCNGHVLPMGARPELTALVHTHWAHRVTAYLLGLLVLVAALRTWRNAAATRASRHLAACALLAVTAQITIGAALVNLRLPQALRIAHVATGVFTFGVLVAWALVSVRTARMQSKAARFTEGTEPLVLAGGAALT